MVATDTPVDAKAVVAEPAAPVSGGSVATYAVNSVPVLPVVALADSAAMNTASGGMSGFYLQFGAYGLRSNAEAIYKHLTTTLLEKIQGQLPPVEIVQQGTLYRLFSGPFTSRAEAMAALQMTSGVVKALIVQR